MESVVEQARRKKPKLMVEGESSAPDMDWDAVAEQVGMTAAQCEQRFLTLPLTDRLAIFIGRVVMMLIISMTCVMLYEVFLRYAIEAPTLWANEVTLWIGGFVFLLSGFYGMQQRSHIRIFILYDAVPRWLQRVFDTVWVFIFVVFAFFLIYGSYKQVFIVKFYNWEMFGTAFDPPIPATIQPMVLIVIVLVAIQAVLNLINDWNLEPEVHTAADDIDEDELEAIKRAVQGDK